MMITRSELLDVVYRFYPRGALPYAKRLHKGEGGGAEHPLLFLWLCAESGEGLAKGAQLRSGEHQSHGEARVCAYPWLEARGGRSEGAVTEHLLLWFSSGSEEALAERAQLRSGEHPSCVEARVCAYILAPRRRREEGSSREQSVPRPEHAKHAIWAGQAARSCAAASTDWGWASNSGSGAGDEPGAGSQAGGSSG